MATSKTAKAKKRTSQLRTQQHAHVRKSKPRAPLIEMKEIPRTTSQEEAKRIAEANNHHVSNVVVDIDVDKLVDTITERLAAAAPKPIAEPAPDRIVNGQAPPPSPGEAAMLDVINASQETEKLMHELALRLAPVLKESGGEVGVLGRASAGSIPLVNAMDAHVNHLILINGQLLDLLDRLAT